jgi:F0F1-type ATP synthase membrane subunit b/b'
MAASSFGVARGAGGGVMAVVYKPTHKILGQNARSIEYELRKIAKKLADLEARVAALEP